jgi:hypothetical protein
MQNHISRSQIRWSKKVQTGQLVIRVRAIDFSNVINANSKRDKNLLLLCMPGLEVQRI